MVCLYLWFWRALKGRKGLYTISDYSGDIHIELPIWLDFLASSRQPNLNVTVSWLLWVLFWKWPATVRRVSGDGLKAWWSPLHHSANQCWAVIILSLACGCSATCWAPLSWHSRRAPLTVAAISLFCLMEWYRHMYSCSSHHYIKAAIEDCLVALWKKKILRKRRIY